MGWGRWIINGHEEYGRVIERNVLHLHHGVDTTQYVCQNSQDGSHIKGKLYLIPSLTYQRRELCRERV